LSLSGPYDNAEPASVAKVNKTNVITMDGADLATLDKTKFRIVTCTATGSGFTIDHVYLFSTDGTTAIDLSAGAAHTHSSASDGGEVIKIFESNPTACDLWLTKTTDLDVSGASTTWIETVTSTGSTANDTDVTTGERSIKLLTGATSGSGSTISYPHLKLGFGNYCFYQTKLRISTFSSLALHTGVGADDITAADSNTRKFQAEICTTTNNNWWLRTANGSANSASDTGIAATANRVKVDIEHDPLAGTPTTYLYIDGVVLSKTTNIPVDQATADNNLIKHSIKNSTAADRPLFVYGSRLYYKINDTWGH